MNNIEKYLDKNNECLKLREAIVENIIAIDEKLDNEKDIKELCDFVDNDFTTYSYFLYDFDMFCKSTLDSFRDR